MGEMENVAEYYYEKLKVSSNPGLELSHFFKEITGKETGRSEIIMINKLLKVFGRFTVYFAILELSKFDNLEGNLYPLLFTIAKSRFEKIYENTFTNAFQPLEKEINLIEKQKEKIKFAKIKFPDSDGLK